VTIDDDGLAPSGAPLETTLCLRQVTTDLDAGEEYEVILKGERDQQRTPASLENLSVRSDRSGQLSPLANLVRERIGGFAESLKRFNRLRAITIEVTLADGLALGAALDYLETKVRENLPEQARIDDKGRSRDFHSSNQGCDSSSCLTAIGV
jgi:multidrug efflux pump